MTGASLPGQATLRYLFAFAALRGMAMALVAATDVIFFLSKNLSFSQINTLEICVLVAMFVFEIPTGIIADRYGAKLSLLCSCVLRLAGFAIVLGSGAFGLFAIGYIALGIGSTFASGAFEGWVANCARRGGVDMGRVFVKLSYASRTGSIIGAIGGGISATHFAGSIWLLAALATTLALIPVLLADGSDGRAAPATELPQQSVFASWQRDLLEGLAACFQHRLVWILICYDAVSQFGMTAAAKLWQPHFKMLLGAQSESFLGLVLASFSIVGLVSTKIVARTQHYSEIKRLILAGILAGIPLFAVALTDSALWAYLFFITHVAMQMIKEPIILAVVHRHIEDQHRARVGSTMSVIMTVFEIAGFIFFGYLADRYGAREAIFWSGFAFILSVAPLFLFFKNTQDRGQGVNR